MKFTFDKGPKRYTISVAETEGSSINIYETIIKDNGYYMSYTPAQKDDKIIWSEHDYVIFPVAEIDLIVQKLIKLIAFS